MTTQEIKQDFESALIKHMHFKSRLRSYLFGNTQHEGTLRDPEQCSLGQWVAARVRGPYRHLPEARLFDQRHQDIHVVANRLLDLYQAGETEQATAGLAEMQGIADEMVTLLQTMQARLRTGADNRQR